jgi:hypothetical protein
LLGVLGGFFKLVLVYGYTEAFPELGIADHVALCEVAMVCRRRGEVMR